MMSAKQLRPDLITLNDMQNRIKYCYGIIHLKMKNDRKFILFSWEICNYKKKWLWQLRVGIDTTCRIPIDWLFYVCRLHFVCALFHFTIGWYFKIYFWYLSFIKFKEKAAILLRQWVPKYFFNSYDFMIERKYYFTFKTKFC